MTIEALRLNHRAKNQLATLKKNTGIENWNILCRWALCVSLAEPSKPNPKSIKRETAVEIAWKVFSGQYSDVYLGLLEQRAAKDGLEVKSEVVQEQLRLHVHRGIGYLAARNRIRSISDLVKIAA